MTRQTCTERWREWCDKNPERVKAQARERYRANREAIIAKAAKWAAENPQRRKAIYATYRNKRQRNHDAWARHMVSVIKARCVKNGVMFSLTPADIIAALPADGRCPALGVPLTFGEKLNRNSPSVDRIIPSMGYVAHNIAVISYRANSMKLDANDPAQLRMVADYMERSILKIRSPFTEGGTIV